MLYVLLQKTKDNLWEPQFLAVCIFKKEILDPKEFFSWIVILEITFLDLNSLFSKLEVIQVPKLAHFKLSLSESLLDTVLHTVTRRTRHASKSTDSAVVLSESQ